VTFIDDKANPLAELIAFDTGPGNALIDDFVRLRTGQPQDDEGRAAAAGKVDAAAVARILAHPFFAKPPPKSLDRNAFRQWLAEEGGLTAKSTEDGAATLTAGSRRRRPAHGITVLPRPPLSWIVAGGGTRNPTLMRMLAESRRQPRSRPRARSAGRPTRSRHRPSPIWRCDHSRALPLTFPTTTGVPRPMPGGVLAR